MSFARVVLVFMSALPGFAIPITGGSMTLTGFIDFQQALFSLTGENFDVRGGGGFAFPGFGTCNFPPCQPGETVNLGVLLHWGDDAGGEGTINGVYYNNLFFNNHNHGWSMSVPPLQLVAGVTSYTVPFTMDGGMRIYDCHPAGCSVPVCIFNCEDGSITGMGTMTATFAARPEGLYLREMTYDFAAPIPEPSTILLISAAVSLLWVRRRRLAD
jgi:hypothetical protein